LKSRRCAGSLESTWPPIFVGVLLSVEALEPPAPLGLAAGVLVLGCGGVAGCTDSPVFGAGVGAVFRSQPAKVSDNAARDAASAAVVKRIRTSIELNMTPALQGRGPA